MLSGVTGVLAISFGFGETMPVFQHHCPMAFGNKGAIWLQKDDQTRNPYFGSTMLKCADRVELIDGDTAIDRNWDTHAHMSNYNRMAPNVDKPIAAIRL